MPPWRRPETQQFRQRGWSRSRRTWGWRRGQPQAWWTQHSWGGLRCEWEISNLVNNLGKSVHAQKNSGSRSVKTLGFLFSTTKYSCVVLGWFHSISRNSVWQAQNKDYRRNFAFPHYNFDNLKKWQGVPFLGLGLSRHIYCQIAPVEKKVPFIGQKLIPAVIKFIPSVRQNRTPKVANNIKIHTSFFQIPLNLRYTLGLSMT